MEKLYKIQEIGPKQWAILKHLILLLFLLGIFITFSQKINLTNSDIGRHLKNGEMAITDQRIFSDNLYSYTEPDTKVINHHWGAGLIFYIVWSVFSFEGITILSASILTATLFVLFHSAKSSTNYAVALLFSVLALPLFASRVEVRPESFSYLLMAVYIYILTHFLNNPKSKWIYILPILQLFWVNLHIFFIFGNVLILFYLLHGFITHTDKPTLQKLTLVFIVTFIINVINPNMFQGVLVPLTIFKNYAYMLAENQSIFFMQKRNPQPMYIHYIFLALATLLLLQNTLLNTKKSALKTYILDLLILLLFGFMGFKAIRLFPLFGIAFIAYGSKLFYSSFKDKYNVQCIILSGILILFAFSISGQYFSYFNVYSGWGLDPHGQHSAKFFKENKLHSPIFNNYDIGSYLVFELYPEHKVFVDNRPEAYTNEFFTELYVPMQESNEIWKEKEQEYGFNTIYFYRHDQTPWGQSFLIERFKDPTWVPVFVDEYTIIFAKDNEVNKKIIEKYRLPDELFSIVKN